NPIITKYVCTMITFTSITFFFFQAEDGIRDFHVTGVQTCALPISTLSGHSTCCCPDPFRKVLLISHGDQRQEPLAQLAARRASRSEERRVGKSVDPGGRRVIDKPSNCSRQLSHIQNHKRNKKPTTR